MGASGVPSHVSPEGLPRMVDVAAKPVTARQATARARLRIPPEALSVLQRDDWRVAKGAVLPTAVVAGVQAAKRTADLIPFCHPLAIEGCDISATPTADGLEILCTVRTTHKTGVEMEALTGAAVAALTVIDMCKSLTPAIEIVETRLLAKSGGRRPYTAP